MTRLTLRGVFTAVAAGGAAVVMAVSGALTIARDRGDLNHAAEQRAQVVLDLVVAFSKPALASYDFYALDPYIEVLKQNPDIAYLAIRDGNGKVVRETPRRPGAALGVKHSIEASGQKLGEVELEVSLEAVAEALRRNTLQSVAQTLIAFLLIAAAIYATFTLLVSGPLRRLGETARQLAEGNLGAPVRVERADEIGALAGSFVSLSARLREVIGQVRAVSLEIAAAASSLAHSATGLTASTGEQAASLEQTAASLEEITGAVKQNAASAREASEIAGKSHLAAERGGQAVASTVASMQEIARSSRRIADIVGVVDAIAFQTNLLALNAAVEAARAGSEGRGFAVVATEVRGLAQRSATAAREIGALIRDSVAKSEEGSRLADRSGKTLEEITVSVKQVADLVAGIAGASREQSSGVEQVSQSVAQIDRGTRDAADQSVRLSETSQALAGLAEELTALVGRFRLEAQAEAPAGNQPRADRAASMLPAGGAQAT